MPLILGVCGVMLSIGTIAAGVAVGMDVLPGKNASTTAKVSARAPKISDPT